MLKKTTPVQIDQEQDAGLRFIANQRKVSKAAVMRWAIDEYLLAHLPAGFLEEIRNHGTGISVDPGDTTSKAAVPA